MIVERPEDWALKEEKSIFLIRRGYDNVIDKIKGGKKADREDIKKYRGYFEQLYRNLNKYEGEEFSKMISERLDLNNYMRWLAFNYFVRNGDYTDEAYFYVDPDNDKFRIIPWDYDDIFALLPHEGIEQNRKIIGDKMFFSIEDDLDRKIVSDPYLYKLYLVQLEDILIRLSPEVIKDICENTYAELYPYFLNNEIISQTKYDRYKDVSLDGMKTNIQTIYGQLMMSRSIYLNSIAGQSK
jgi:spore coat protein H